MKARVILAFFTAICLHPLGGVAAGPSGRVVGWGWNFNGQATGVPTRSSGNEANCNTGVVAVAGQVLTDAVAIAAGGDSFALRREGTVVGWGWNGSGAVTGVAPMHDGSNSGPVVIGGRVLSDVAAISAGDSYALALKRNGTVVGWGVDYGGGQIKGPLGLSNVVAIAASRSYGGALALLEDGTVQRVFSDTHVEPTGISNAVAIAGSSADDWPAIAVLRDGTVRVNVDPRNFAEPTPPAEATNVIAAAAGSFHYLTLRRDGTVFGWGLNACGEATGTRTEHPASGLVRLNGRLLTNIVAIAASEDFSMALRSDGTVVAWGANRAGQAGIPQGLSGVVAISAGWEHALAITTNSNFTIKR